VINLAFILTKNDVREHHHEEYIYQLVYEFEQQFGGFTSDFNFFLKKLKMDTDIESKIIRNKIIQLDVQITKDYKSNEYFHFKNISQAKKLLDEFNIILKLVGE
jgi:ribosomal protein S17E